MSTRGVCMPIFAVECDAAGCDAKFSASTWWEDRGVREVAAKNGWQVRPNGGKGSRSAPDLCPEHRTDGGA